MTKSELGRRGCLYYIFLTRPFLLYTAQNCNPHFGFRDVPLCTSVIRCPWKTKFLVICRKSTNWVNRSHVPRSYMTLIVLRLFGPVKNSLDAIPVHYPPVIRQQMGISPFVQLFECIDDVVEHRAECTVTDSPRVAGDVLSCLRVLLPLPESGMKILIKRNIRRCRSFQAKSRCRWRVAPTVLRISELSPEK